MAVYPVGQPVDQAPNTTESTGACSCKPGRIEAVRPPGFIWPRDPWQHRSDGMRCRTCMWYCPKQDGPAEPVQEKGRCRRHAPTMNGYPVVFPHDWCGDHKLS